MLIAKFAAAVQRLPLFLLKIGVLAALPLHAIHAQHLLVTVTDSSGERVADAVAEIVLPAGVAAQFATTADAIIDQVDKEFLPTVTTVVAGSRISFPNSDDILHHVYSFSPINTFDIPLYGSDNTTRFIEQFPVAGVVEIGCNIHDWMLAYIYVAETSKAAISNEEGVAQIQDIPPGSYPLRIWHARLPRDMSYHMVDVVIPPNGSVTVEVALELERDRRIRRAPSADRKRYR